MRFFSPPLYGPLGSWAGRCTSPQSLWLSRRRAGLRPAPPSSCCPPPRNSDRKYVQKKKKKVKARILVVGFGRGRRVLTSTTAWYAPCSSPTVTSFPTLTLP